MTNEKIIKFGARWGVTSLGLWIASAILGPDRFNAGSHLSTVLGAGLFLALINLALKPLLVIMSFPAIILSLGFFMLLVNGFLILVASWLYSSLYVKSFGVAIIAGAIITLVNFLVMRAMKDL